MNDYRAFSADSHVSEPPDLWTARLDRRFRERAPRVETREHDGRLQDMFVYEGFPPHRVAVGLAAAALDSSRQEFQRTRGNYRDARPGGWDPVERLKDQDLDGVEGEVLHTTLGFRLFWLEDPELQRACFGVYNDWLAEFCRSAPQRLLGLGLISLHDVGLAVQELERCARLGLRGAMIWCSPPEARPYSGEEYDPFWAAAQALGMPVSLHSLTGHAESRTPLNWFLHLVVMHHEVERSIATLILSGVLERFPRLRVVSVENGAGWVPFFLERIDLAARVAAVSFPTRLSIEPSAYFRRQVYVAYVDDPVAVENRQRIGVENLMWSSDYPHSASTWPHSQTIIARDFQGVAPDERRRIVRDNVVALYSPRGD
jgi:predicted TIM-barrel fold metal-dependent hydrolase